MMKNYKTGIPIQNRRSVALKLILVTLLKVLRFLISLSGFINCYIVYPHVICLFLNVSSTKRD